MMGLFTPSWMNGKFKGPKQRSCAIKALSEVTDQRKLEQAARSAPSSEVRELAVGKLESDQTLCEIAGSDSAASVRMAAAQRLRGVELQRRLLAETGDDAIRLYLLQELGMREEYNRLAALTRHSLYGGAEALKAISDPAVLAEIAFTHRDFDMRCQAIGRITDPSILCRIVTGDCPAAKFPWDIRARQCAARGLVGTDGLSAAYERERGNREIFEGLMGEIPLAYLDAALDLFPENGRFQNAAAAGLSAETAAALKKELTSARCHDRELLLRFLFDESSPGAITTMILRKLLVFCLPEGFGGNIDILWLLDWDGCRGMLASPLQDGDSCREACISALRGLRCRDWNNVLNAVRIAVSDTLRHYGAEPTEAFFQRLNYARQMCEDASGLNWMTVLNKNLRSEQGLLELIVRRGAMYSIVEAALRQLRDPALVRALGKTVLSRAAAGEYYTGNVPHVRIGSGWGKFPAQAVQETLAALGENSPAVFAASFATPKAEESAAKDGSDNLREEADANADEGFYGWKMRSGPHT